MGSENQVRLIGTVEAVVADPRELKSMSETAQKILLKSTQSHKW